MKAILPSDAEIYAVWRALHEPGLPRRFDFRWAIGWRPEKRFLDTLRPLPKPWWPSQEYWEQRLPHGRF